MNRAEKGIRVMALSNEFSESDLMAIESAFQIRDQRMTLHI